MATLVVLETRRVNHGDQQKAERIDRDVPFTARHFLSPVEAMLFSSFRRTDGLAVDDRHGWGWLLAGRFPNHFTKTVMHLLPRAVPLPVAKHAVHSVPMGKFLGQVPPLTPGPIPVQDRVENTPPINRLATSLFRLWQDFFDDSPLFVGQIAGILRTTHCYDSFRGDGSATPGVEAIFRAYGNFKTRSNDRNLWNVWTIDRRLLPHGIQKLFLSTLEEFIP